MRAPVHWARQLGPQDPLSVYCVHTVRLHQALCVRTAGLF